MSKKPDIFKSKKFLTGIAVGASVIIVGSSTLGIMLPSYFSWKEYYDAAIADRDYQKYLQTLPLEITLPITTTAKPRRKTPILQ